MADTGRRVIQHNVALQGASKDLPQLLQPRLIWAAKVVALSRGSGYRIVYALYD